MVYLTDLKASVVGQMYFICLEVGVGWDRHYGFLPSGHSLSFLVYLTGRLKRADIYPASLVASSV